MEDSRLAALCSFWRLWWDTHPKGNEEDEDHEQPQFPITTATTTKSASASTTPTTMYTLSSMRSMLTMVDHHLSSQQSLYDQSQVLEDVLAPMDLDYIIQWSRFLSSPQQAAQQKPPSVIFTLGQHSESPPPPLDQRINSYLQNTSSGERDCGLKLIADLFSEPKKKQQQTDTQHPASLQTTNTTVAPTLFQSRNSVKPFKDEHKPAHRPVVIVDLTGTETNASSSLNTTTTTTTTTAKSSTSTKRMGGGQGFVPPRIKTENGMMATSSSNQTVSSDQHPTKNQMPSNAGKRTSSRISAPTRDPQSDNTIEQLDDDDDERDRVHAYGNKRFRTGPAPSFRERYNRRQQNANDDQDEPPSMPPRCDFQSAGDKLRTDMRKQRRNQQFVKLDDDDGDEGQDPIRNISIESTNMPNSGYHPVNSLFAAKGVSISDTNNNNNAANDKTRQKFKPPFKKEEDQQPQAAQSAAKKPAPKKSGEDKRDILSELFPDGNVPDRLKSCEPRMIEMVMNEILDRSPAVTWNDIAGLRFAKNIVKEIVVLPLLRPDIFTGLRAPPKGLLLFGPPGTGKTLIGKAIASESKATFFNISASSLMSKWVGEGEKMVRTLFAVASWKEPCVIFIDEVDSLLSQRTEGDIEASRRIKTEFLVQLDGASTTGSERVLVLGATNRPHEIDEAARRRFTKQLYIPLPDAPARKALVANLLKKATHGIDDAGLDKIVHRTKGYSGSDLANLVKDAAMGPVREIASKLETIDIDSVRPINERDFDEALKQIRPSVHEKDLQLYRDWAERAGCLDTIESVEFT